MIRALVSESWIQKVGWTLLHFLWQGTAIAAIYGILRAALTRSLSAQGRYVLACAALVAMAVAPPLTFLLIPDPRGSAAWTLSAAESQMLLPAVVGLWLLGVVVFSIRLMCGWRFTTRLRATSHPAPAQWRQTLERIALRIGVTQLVRLRVSSLVDVPTVIGWLRPVLLVPVEFFTGVSLGHITALLAHEMAHIRRRDYLANIVQSITEAVLFYHPAVWWISEQIRAERELCCDDLAVAATGDALAYARALAELESRQPARLVLAANGGSLVNRVRRLIEPAHTIANSVPGPGAAWAMTLLWLAGVGVTAVHSVQTTPVRLVVPALAPMPAPAPLLALAGKARKTLLYDPLLATQPTLGKSNEAVLPAPPALVTIPDPPPVPAIIADANALPVRFQIAPPPVTPQTSSEEAPPEAPTFSAAAKLVQVDVIARSKGAPANGLTKDDFTLLDNGQPQKLAVFSVTSSQTSGPAAVPLPAGAVSNRLERGGDSLANATVVLIDRVNTAPADQAFAIRRITKFLSARRKKDTMPDRIGIYTFGSGGLRAVQEITDNSVLLRHAAESLKAPETSYDFGPARIRAMETKRALEAIARHLASVPGRKGLIWVTGGFPLTTPEFDSNPDMEEAARALNDADVALYAVDARGLVGSLSGATAISNAESRMPPVSVPAGDTPGTEVMTKLAGLTGGLALYNTNGIEDSVRKALDDAELTYTLGFYPGPEQQDAAWHKLKIEVARPGVSVRYRGKYFASRLLALNDRPALPELLKAPLDATQLQLVAETMPDRARPGFRQVSVSVDLHQIHLENQNKNWAGALDVSFFLEGSSTARKVTGNLEIPEGQLAAALKKGIVVDDSIEVTGQTESLRVVAQDRATGAAGSVRVPLR